jgi:hypothetical protein
MDSIEHVLQTGGCAGCELKACCGRGEGPSFMADGRRVTVRMPGAGAVGRKNSDERINDDAVADGVWDGRRNG